MTDDKLKQALAKMLPEKLCDADIELYWWPESEGQGHRVLDTELLHLCALVEKTLTDDEDQKYRDEIVRAIDDAKWSKLERAIMRLKWQQRAAALAKVKGIEV